MAQMTLVFVGKGLVLGGLTPSKIEVIGAKQGDSLPRFHTLAEKISKNAASIDHGLGFV